MWSSLRRAGFVSSNTGILNRKLARPNVMGYGVRWLSTNEYHELADETLENITESYEKLIEQRPEVDVDLSQGVLTLVTPAGTYVINKQPPNLQIWLSSPLSGPKRYDWDEDSKRWLYPRENSSLGELLKQETKASMDLELDLDVD